MRSSIFRFKQFSIDQEGCGMKISTDGIIFGSWIPAGESLKVLDVGTGTGLLSLMLAQRFPAAQIDAIELDPKAAAKAQLNFQNSPWSERLKLIHNDFMKYRFEDKFDLVVSNPPFYSTLHEYSSAERSTARNTTSLPLDLLVEKSANLLSKIGRLALILPAEKEKEVQKIFRENELRNILHRTIIRPNKRSAANRILLVASQSALDGETSEREILIHTDQGEYSEQFRNLTGAFYL